MNRLDTFALGSGFGALCVIASMHLAARYAGRHFLALKENS